MTEDRFYSCSIYLKRCDVFLKIRLLLHIPRSDLFSFFWGEGWEAIFLAELKIIVKKNILFLDMDRKLFLKIKYQCIKYTIGDCIFDAALESGLEQPHTLLNWRVWPINRPEVKHVYGEKRNQVRKTAEKGERNFQHKQQTLGEKLWMLGGEKSRIHKSIVGFTCKKTKTGYKNWGLGK